MRILRYKDDKFTCSSFLLVLLPIFSEAAEVVTLLMDRPFDSSREEAGLVVSSGAGLVLPMENPLASPCTLPCTLLSSWLNFTLTKFAILMTWRCSCCLEQSQSQTDLVSVEISEILVSRFSPFVESESW